jgi:nucleotide-binding universal stress UspA family protein
MRSLLVHTHDDDCFEARLQVALDLARKFDAHLTLMQTIAYDVVVPTDPFGVSAVDVSQANVELAQEFRSRIEARLKQEDVRWDWAVEAGYDGTSMTRHAALNDLALVAGTLAGSDSRKPSPLAGMLAIHCRSPIMVVPKASRGIDTGKAAVVCWNGSLEAARAMRAAVPLLTAASRVHILSVGDPEDIGDEALPAIAGATYLERHGVDCEVVQLPSGSDPVHEVLHKAAQARDAGLMVMGAYGQPRFIETLFGGVTRSVLAEPPMPVLMAH